MIPGPEEIQALARAEAEKAQIAAVKRIFGTVAPIYDFLNRALSLREDVRWRRFTARCLRPGPTGRVLDVATGTGDLALAIAALKHKPMVVGLDLVPEMLGPARKKGNRRQRPIPFLAGDGTELPFADESFDAVTIAFGIRNIPRRIKAMSEMKRVLVPGGRAYVLEFTTPESSMFKALYRPYLKHVLPLLGGLVSGDRESYLYLARTVLEFPTPEKFRREMEEAGLTSCRSHALTGGIAWVHVGEKPLRSFAPPGAPALNAAGGRHFPGGEKVR